ncbi:hypothetical protein D3C83_324280 [compost metagenome]
MGQAGARKKRLQEAAQTAQLAHPGVEHGGFVKVGHSARWPVGKGIIESVRHHLGGRV